MGSFAVADVLLIRFPFSDLRHTKLRPVLVVGLSDFDNLIVCQITSKAPDSRTAIELTAPTLLKQTGLNRKSYIRANKLFTADPGLIVRRLGNIDSNTRELVYTLLLKTFKSLHKS